MSSWLTGFIALAAAGIAFGVHMFGQGLWYMAAAEHKWDQSTARQRQRRQRFAYAVAFGGPVVIAAGALLVIVQT